MPLEFPAGCKYIPRADPEMDPTSIRASRELYFSARTTSPLRFMSKYLIMVTCCCLPAAALSSDHTLSRRAHEGLLRPAAQPRTHTHTSLVIAMSLSRSRASCFDWGQQQLISPRLLSTTKSHISVVV
jgi:hypothetical protein